MFLTGCTDTIKIKAVVFEFKTGGLFDFCHHGIDFNAFIIDDFVALRANDMRMGIRFFTVIAVTALAELQLQCLTHGFDNGYGLVDRCQAGGRKGRFDLVIDLIH